MDYFPISAALSIGFVAGLLMAFLKPKTTKTITFLSFAIAALGGCFVYGYAYFSESDNWFLTLLRTVVDVSRMFLGENNHEAMKDSVLMQNSWYHALFWIVHCYAIFTTVSAVVTAIGNRMVRSLRLRFIRQDRIYLIYGIHADTLKLGQEISQKRRGVLVYVDHQVDPADKEVIENMGGVVRIDNNALEGTEGFLRSIGCRKNRRITLCAVMEDPSDNFHYAEKLLRSLETIGVRCRKTRLVIRAQEQSAMARLQVADGQYGYGYVSAFDGASLAARMLVKAYPPCNYIHFDENGKATENFEALIVGFGQVGQAVLKKLIMFGQFEGSTFRATVFAPDCLEASGSFSRQFDVLQQQYHIEMIPSNAKSSELYEFLKKRGKELKYVALCAGSEKLNRELAEDIATYCSWLNLQLPVFACSQRSVKACDDAGFVREVHTLYQLELLSAEKLDRRAMLLNYQYAGDTEQTPEALWMNCPVFDRQSNRAAADFFQAFLCAVGKTEEEVCSNGWELTEKQKEILGRHEHLRWWAFHACMGYQVMEKETLDARGRRYLEDIKNKVQKPIRITKDTTLQLHACMVPWEQLPEVAAWESVYTGKVKDYQAMDVNNVLMVPTLLRQEAKQ